MVLSRKVRRENRSLRWRTWAITQWIRYMFRVLAVGPIMSRASAIGAANIPTKGGVIVIFWHPTVRDPHNIFKVFPRNLAFMAGEFLFKGLRGWLLKRAGHIVVKRGTADAALARDEAVRVVEAGGALALAPEGGCTPKGMIVGPFKTGPARIALATGAPVHMALPFGTSSRRRPGLRGLVSKPPVTIVFTESLRPVWTFSSAGDDEAVIRTYTEYLHTTMLDLVTEGVERLAERNASGQPLVSA
jgi:1-acyl-sn-glycerol-3-phosphate acyltransferase